MLWVIPLWNLIKEHFLTVLTRKGLLKDFFKIKAKDIVEIVGVGAPEWDTLFCLCC